MLYGCRHGTGGRTISAHDVAAYILEKQGATTSMKLQKLVYYSQAWSLVWDERPLFDERVEAWANGPIVRDLYDEHRGQFMVETWAAGNTNNLDHDAIETIDKVLEFYGPKDSHWLSTLTHKETPWRDARTPLAEDERGDAEITPASMMEYYSGLTS